MRIYEAHVRGLTQLHPDIHDHQRGTLSALSHPSIIAHLKSLNIDVIQLMPIFDSHGTYWGYDPVSWFNVNPTYGGSKGTNPVCMWVHFYGQLNITGERSEDVKPVLVGAYDHDPLPKITQYKIANNDGWTQHQGNILLSGLSHVMADFVMSSSDQTLYAAGKMQALVSYSGSGDYSIVMQHCDVAVSTFDASSVDVELNTYSSASNILQFRVKANKTGSTGAGIDVRVTASAVQHG